MYAQAATQSSAAARNLLREHQWCFQCDYWLRRHASPAHRASGQCDPRKLAWRVAGIEVDVQGGEILTPRLCFGSPGGKPSVSPSKGWQAIAA